MKKKLIRFSVKLLGWAILAAGLTIGLVLCGMIARLIARAFLIGWRLSLILALALVIVPRASASTNGAPVYFSLRQLTGLPKTDRFMLIPDTRQNPVTDGTHLFGGFTLTISTVGGTVTTNLQPIGYTLAVPGWSRTLHLVIPDTTNTVNAVNCITNGLGSYNAATVLGLQSVATSNSASVTFSGNGTSTDPLTATARGGSTIGFTGWITNSLQTTIISTNLVIGTNGVTTNLFGLWLTNSVVFNGLYMPTNGDSRLVSPFGATYIYYRPGTTAWVFQENYIGGSYAWCVGTNTYMARVGAEDRSPDYRRPESTDPAFSQIGYPLNPNSAAWFSPMGYTNPPDVYPVFFYLTTNQLQNYNLTFFTNGLCVTNLIQ